jgi:uncharacterized protein HemY
MSTLVTVLALVGLALGLVVALVVVALFNKIVRHALEIARYDEPGRRRRGRAHA